MRSLRVLLRFLLVLTFCLEGSLSAWSASAAALDDVHQVVVADAASPVVSDQDCAEEGVPGEGRSVHDDCECAQGLGCACACVFPVGAMAGTIAFAARHPLATAPAVRARVLVVPIVLTRVFRPPIG